jgi:phage tail-like protein
MTPPPHFLLNEHVGWRPAREEHPGPAVITSDDGEQASLLSSGWWTKPLDSQISNCVWDRLEIDLSLPDDCAISVFTQSEDWIGGQSEHPSENTSSSHGRPDDWRGDLALSLSNRPADVSADAVFTADGLIQGPPAQCLRLCISLSSSGDKRPEIKAIRVYFPRRSYADMLPAVYRDIDENRRLLERFLAVYQRSWDQIDDRLDRIAEYFDPKTTPDAFLDFLAGWLKVPIDANWRASIKRRLLCYAPSYYPKRGTASGLRGWLGECLAAFAGYDRPVPADALPQIVEGFRNRRYLWMRFQRSIREPARLWGAAIKNRAQIGVNTEVGAARLYRSGGPETDLIDRHSHRYDIYVPAAWADKMPKQTLSRLISLESPGHATCQLHKVHPMTRIGVQSRLGLDTLIGELPCARLASCPRREPEFGSRLDHDMLLCGCEPDGHASPDAGSAGDSHDS